MKDAFDEVLAELQKLPPKERIEKLQRLLAGLGKAEKKRFEKAQQEWLWFNAVHRVIHDHTNRHQNKELTRQGLIREDLKRISEETGTEGKTPEQSLSYYLQRVRDEGIIDFVDNRGTYRLVAHDCDLRSV